MGGADFMHILYSEFFNYDPNDMTWPFRDRFFMDAGHLSTLMYAQYYLLGNYEKDDIANFRQWGSITPGHPEVDVERGIENTSGPLGQGHAMGVGAAIALGWSYVVLGQLAPRVLIGVERFVGPNPVKGASRYAYAAALAVVAVVGGLAVALAAVMTAVGIGALVVVLLALVVGPAALTRWRNNRAAGNGAAIQDRKHGAAHGLPAAGTFVQFLARWRWVTVPVALVVGAIALTAALQVKSGFEITDFLSSNSDFATSIDRVDEHFPSSGQGSSFVLVDGDLTSPDALAALDGAVGMLDASPADFGRNGGGQLAVQLHAGDLVRMTLASPEAVEAMADGGANLADANGDGYPDSPAAIRAVYDYIAEFGVPAPDGAIALTPDEIAGVLSDDGGTVQTTAVTVMVGSFTDGQVIVPAEDALNAAALSIEQDAPGLGTRRGEQARLLLVGEIPQRDDVGDGEDLPHVLPVPGEGHRQRRGRRADSPDSCGRA